MLTFVIFIWVLIGTFAVLIIGFQWLSDIEDRKSEKNYIYQQKKEKIIEDKPKDIEFPTIEEFNK